jgi:hypothetical protein
MAWYLATHRENFTLSYRYTIPQGGIEINLRLAR